MSTLPMTLSLEIAGDSSEAECAHGGKGVGPGPQARLCLEQVTVSLATLFYSGIPVASMSPFFFLHKSGLFYQVMVCFRCFHPIQPTWHPQRPLVTRPLIELGP